MPASEVRAQLNRILAAEAFVSSQRLCRFLRFIVERTLDAEVERLKEFVVAMEVFDRDETYDPSIDSIVRVEARRLRTKLKAYYEGPGSQDPVLITLRPGSYVPVFSPLAAGSPAEPAGPAAALSHAEEGDLTVAVLPFVNMSPEPDQDYFCDGITEEIINALTALRDLSVVARTSAFQFKGQAVDVREVGQRLGARVVVEGSVRKAGDQLRITAQAIDAKKGYHLWSETYRRDLADVFAVQEELSLAIARTLSVRLPARRERPRYVPTLDAYAAYLRGLFLVHQQTATSLFLSLGHFRELTRQYPDYAAPFAGMATAHLALALFGAVSGREVEPEMRRCAEEAVRLDPDSVDAWSILGGMSGCWDFDWAESEKRLLHAIALQPANSDPHSWYGMVLTRQGRFAEAEASLTRAARLNPLVAPCHSRLAYLHYLQGDDARATAELDRAFSIEPRVAYARLVQALMLMRRGDFARAYDELSLDVESQPMAMHLGTLAAASFRLGRKKEGQARLALLQAAAAERYIAPLAFAHAYIGMGDFDQAFEYLDRSISDRVLFVGYLKTDPFYQPLRADSRFEALLRRINLSP